MPIRRARERIASRWQIGRHLQGTEAASLAEQSPRLGSHLTTVSGARTGKGGPGIGNLRTSAPPPADLNERGDRSANTGDANRQGHSSVRRRGLWSSQ